jgi:hypothetical protein
MVDRMPVLHKGEGCVNRFVKLSAVGFRWRGHQHSALRPADPPTDRFLGFTATAMPRRCMSAFRPSRGFLPYYERESHRYCIALGEDEGIVANHFEHP